MAKRDRRRGLWPLSKGVRLVCGEGEKRGWGCPGGSITGWGALSCLCIVNADVERLLQAQASEILHLYGGGGGGGGGA